MTQPMDVGSDLFALLFKSLDQEERPKSPSSSSVRSGLFIGPGVVYGFLRAPAERHRSRGDQDKG